MRGRNNQDLSDAIATDAVSVGRAVNPAPAMPQGQMPQQPMVQQQQYLPPYAYEMMQPTSESQIDSVSDDQIYLVHRLPLLVRLARRARGLVTLTPSQKNEIAAQAAIGLTGVEVGDRFDAARAFAREWLSQNMK